MFNIMPILETVAPIIGGIAGIVSSVNDTPSTTPVVVESPKCEVMDKPQQPVQMPNIVFNLNIYINGKKAGSNGTSDGIYIDSNIE